MAASKHEKKIREVVRRRRPRGWHVVERPPHNNAIGMVTQTRHLIYVPPLVDEDALFVFLHEVGHIVNRHLHPGRPLPGDAPSWQIEYEAESWAIAAMRAEGFAVSRRNLAAARQNVRHRIEEALAAGRLDAELEGTDLAALKFAAPRSWRKWI
ncbi:MAG TPA: hypothetical protein VIJ72_01455 [Rhizomicrobium sp.]